MMPDMERKEGNGLEEEKNRSIYCGSSDTVVLRSRGRGTGGADSGRNGGASISTFWTMTSEEYSTGSINVTIQGPCSGHFTMFSNNYTLR